MLTEIYICLSEEDPVGCPPIPGKPIKEGHRQKFEAFKRRRNLCTKALQTLFEHRERLDRKIHLRVIEFLLNCGAEITLRAWRDACIHLWPEHIELLLSRGAGIHIGKHVRSLYRHNGDWLIVPIVFLVERADVMELLFWAGEHPNATDSRGENDLQFSARIFRSIDKITCRKLLIEIHGQ